MFRLIFVATIAVAAIVVVQPAFALSGINGPSLNGTANADVSTGTIDHVSAVTLPTGQTFTQ